MMPEDIAEQALQGYRAGSNLSRFMLGAWEVKPEWRGAFTGCVHADGTVRAQVVRADDESLAHIHRLLDELRERYGIYGVINTSFNRRGEPIVHTIDQALDARQGMNVDALWLP